MNIFSKAAVKNIEETGNVWGIKSEYYVKTKFPLGPLEIVISWKPGNAFLGRFGGGWNWKLGIQGSGSSWIISLLVLSVWIRRKK